MQQRVSNTTCLLKYCPSQSFRCSNVTPNDRRQNIQREYSFHRCTVCINACIIACTNAGQWSNSCRSNRSTPSLSRSLRRQSTHGLKTHVFSPMQIRHKTTCHHSTMLHHRKPQWLLVGLFPMKRAILATVNQSALSHFEIVRDYVYHIGKRITERSWQRFRWVHICDYVDPRFSLELLQYIHLENLACAKFTDTNR